MPTLVEQLHAAYLRSGWSMAELLRRSDLKLDRSTLRRKLIGETPMSTVECQVLAQTLGVTLVVIPESEARAS